MMSNENPGHQARPPEVRRSRLLMLGWGLVALLPALGVTLFAADLRHLAVERDMRARLLIDAVELRLGDRLGHVERQLATVAHAPGDEAGTWEVPMHGLAVGPAVAGDPPRGETRISAPRAHGDGLRIRVAHRDGDSVASAWIDSAVFADMVGDDRLGSTDMMAIVHEDGTVVAAPDGAEAYVGRRVSGSQLLSPQFRGVASGTYDGPSALDGVDRHHVFRRLPGQPLAILVGVERTDLASIWFTPAMAMLAVSLLLAGGWGWLVRQFERMQGAQAALIRRLEGGEERLRHAHALAGLGEYEWDLDSGKVSLSDAIPAPPGAAASGGYTIEDVLASVHPDDRDYLRALSRRITEDGEPVQAHYRVVLPDGSVRQVLTRSRRLVSEDGRTVVRGVRQDVTELVEAQGRVLEAEAHYRFLFEHNPLPMWLFDCESLRIIEVNDSMLAHYGYSREELVGSSMLMLRPADDVDAAREAASEPAATTAQGHVWTHLHRDGHVMRMAIFRHDIQVEGRPARLIAAQDVTAREQAEQRFKLVARATSDAVYDYDAAADTIWWGESYYTRFGRIPGGAEGTAEWRSRIHPADEARVLASFRAALASGQEEWQEQYRYQRGDGSYATVIERGFLLRDPTGRLLRVVGGMLDISERQQYEDQLAFRATHDELTGLPNRQLLQDRLQQALLTAQRYGRQGALIFIDLDDFKLVNDTLGHTAGDRVLREIATRLRSVTRETDTVARFGGDEFVVVLSEDDTGAGMRLALERIAAVLAEPIEVGSTRHVLTASIGWCRYPEAGQDVETLLMHGDLAMYQAKREGRNRAVQFKPEYVDGISRRLQLVSELRRALEVDEFFPVFQPLFDRDNRPVALETLVRWRHPERGVLMPGDFIPICEESGLIVDLGKAVLGHALGCHRRLAEAGLGHLRIAVNVSPAQFTEELVVHVRDALRANDVPAEILELEITEGLLMADPERAIELMRQITALGVSFSVDDFGTGYSSLAYLKRFPIDRLKIDRSFVRDLGVDDDDAAICNSIIGLAHALDIRTVAEGVETALQLDWLRARNIDEVQGYLLGRPVPFDDLLALLAPPAKDLPAVAVGVG